MTKIIQDKDNPIPREVLGQAIITISESIQKLTASGLNRKAIVVLLHDSTRIGKKDIELVLDGLACLKKDYCA